MAAFDPITAQIVTFFAQCILYGMNVITYILAMSHLLWTSSGRFKQYRDVNWILVGVSTSLVLFGTIDVSAALRQQMEAFVLFPATKGGALGFFSNLSDRLTVLKSVDLDTQFLIADGMLIYRCYTVYHRGWKVIIPSILIWCALCAASIRTNILFATLGSPDDASSLYNPLVLVPWLTALFSLTLANNIILTSLICGKIIHGSRRMAKYLPSSSSSGGLYSNAARLVLESCLIYTLLMAILLALYLKGSNGFLPLTEMVLRISAINFDLIIIRVARGVSFEHSTSTLRNTTTNSYNSAKYSGAIGNNSHRMNALRSSSTGNTTIEVTRTVEVVGDGDQSKNKNIDLSVTTSRSEYSDLESQKERI